MKNILFNRKSWFTGRNGMFTSIGLNMSMSHDNMVWLSPITSKKTIAKCDIVIPVENIPELIAELENIVKIKT